MSWIGWCDNRVIWRSKNRLAPRVSVDHLVTRWPDLQIICLVNDLPVVGLGGNSPAGTGFVSGRGKDEPPWDGLQPKIVQPA